MSGIQDKERIASRFSPVGISQAGFSLVELMVASTVGLVIMLAILTLYTNVTRTNDEMAKTNTLVESGRFAIQLLQDDLAHAGFWDTYVPEFDDLTLTEGESPDDIPNSVPQPCLAPSSWTDQIRANRLGIAVQVHSSLPSGCSSTLLNNHKSGTDILVVRHAHTVRTCLSGEDEETDGCENEVSGKLYFQATRCNDEVDSTPYVLSTSGLNLQQRNCTSLAPKRRYISNIYYIRDYAVTAGDGIPTLMRSEFDLDSGAVKAKSPVALVEGIEGFRIELGIDRISKGGNDIVDLSSDLDPYREPVDWPEGASPVNRGDGAPDEFVHCSSVCAIDRLINVVAVKLHLLVRSQTATQGHVDSKSYTLGGQTIAAANDGFKRHVFSSVVRLNNISGRRETP